jgi:hypothetical protein
MPTRKDLENLGLERLLRLGSPENECSELEVLFFFRKGATSGRRPYDSTFHLKHAVAQPLRLGAVMGDVQHRHFPRLPQPVQHVDQLIASVVVERTERFVQQQDRRTRGECPAERDPLLFAAAEISGQPIEQGRQFQPRRQFLDPLGDCRALLPAYIERESEVVADGHGIEQRAILRDVTDASIGGSKLRRLAASETNRSAFQWPQPGNGFENGGLAATALAHEHGVFAARNGEGNARQRELSLANGEVDDFDHRDNYTKTLVYFQHEFAGVP